MTNEEIEKLYKYQLDQHYLNFLEKEKEEISKLNLNSEILKKNYFYGAKSSIKIINSLSKQKSKVITSSTETKTNILSELDNIADKFIEENKKEILELNLNPTILSNVYAQGAFDSIKILTQIRKKYTGGKMTNEEKIMFQQWIEM